MLYLDVDDREEIQADFILEVRTKLQAAYVQAKHLDRATLQSVAEKMGTNRSAVFRHLNGETNPTIKTIADLAWALGKKPSFDLRDKISRAAKTSTNLDDYTVSIDQLSLSKAVPSSRDKESSLTGQIRNLSFNLS